MIPEARPRGLAELLKGRHLRQTGYLVAIDRPLEGLTLMTAMQVQFSSSPPTRLWPLRHERKAELLRAPACSAREMDTIPS